MANSGFDTGFGRREVLRFAAMTGVAACAEQYALAASDFWDKQKPSEWSDQQKEEIRTKSPWAKKVDAEMAAGGRGGGGGDSGGDGDDSGGGGGKKRGGGGGGGSKGGVAPAGNFGQTPSLEMVWVSAKPVQEAHHLDLPAKLDNHYVIAVTGIPPQVLNAAMKGVGGRGGRSGAGADPTGATPPAAPADPTAGLKRGATLVVKGKDPQNADAVLSMNNNATVIFGFAKDALPLTVADKEVEFDLKLGTMSAKGKFVMKDMMYNGELAL
jgi:hypothetical protein